MGGSRLSPFSWLFETKTFPHARTLRSSLLQKLQDSFWVSTGKLRVDHSSFTVGLFDYATGFVPYLFFQALHWCWKNIEQKRARFLLTPLLLANIPLLLGRVIFGIVISFGFAFITIITHLVSQIAARQLIDTTLRYTGRESGQETTTLAAFLTRHGGHLDNLTVSQIPTLLTLVDNSKQVSFKLGLFDNHTTFASAYPALYALNIGGSQAREEARAEQNMPEHPNLI